MLQALAKYGFRAQLIRQVHLESPSSIKFLSGMSLISSSTDLKQSTVCRQMGMRMALHAAKLLRTYEDGAKHSSPAVYMQIFRFSAEV